MTARRVRPTAVVQRARTGEQARRKLYQWSRFQAPELTAGELVRTCEDRYEAGHHRSIEHAFMLEGHNRRSDYHRPTSVTFTDGGYGGSGATYPADFERAKVLLDRYKRFVRYMRDGRHAWTVVECNGYADNSIEHVEESQLTGERRTRLVVGGGESLPRHTCEVAA